MNLYESARAGVGDDAVDGVVPETVIEPSTGDEVAAVLSSAAEQRVPVVIRGGGTKDAWGRTPGRIGVLLGTRRMNRVLTHRAGDLTVSVDAGITLGELNRELAAHGQWLPLDPPFAGRATIGGLLATNDSGPLRHRFGTPRDLVIGIQLATTDGRLTKSGGQVVKNVAGYDLSKMVSGSFGELAAIVGATFKLSPLPSASRTAIVSARDAAAVARVAAAIESTQLEPMAFEVHVRRDAAGRVERTCLVQFGSIEAAVDAQIGMLRDAIGDAVDGMHTIAGDGERDAWHRHATRVWSGAGAVARVSWLPGETATALRAIESLECAELEAVARVGVGSGLIRIDAPLDRQRDAIDALRRSSALGNVVLLRASRELKSLVDVWGPIANAPVIAALKRTLDPDGILGAGRGPIAS